MTEVVSNAHTMPEHDNVGAPERTPTPQRRQRSPPMKFGKQLGLRIQPSLQEGYIDYRKLKDALARELGSVGESPEDRAKAADTLAAAIQREIGRVDAFFADRILRATKQREDIVRASRGGEQLKTELGLALSELSEDMEHLVDFCSLNEHGFMKILKKCDKRASWLGLLERLLPQVKAAQFVQRSQAPREILVWTRKELANYSPAHGGLEREASSASNLAEAVTELNLSRDVQTFNSLELDMISAGSVSRMWISVAQDGLSQAIRVPVVVAKGTRRGPILGITAAVHGNELNGIPLIHRLMRAIDVSELSGIVVAVPVANTPGFLRQQRGYLDGADLNRLMPGKRDGSCAQMFAYQLMDRIISRFNYLIDMHTASVGRINSLYVRANMINPVTSRMAILQNPQIIVHNTGPDGSLRSAALDRGIHAITVEVGDPQRFHRRFIDFALLGVENILCAFKMVPREFAQPDFDPVVCTRSFWIFTRAGGILTDIPDINSWVKEGQTIARIHNIFGDLIDEYVAPSSGIVVGKSVNPVCATGDRILHLGVVTQSYAAEANDGHL